MLWFKKLKTQSVIIILVPALCSVQPQSPFPAIPGSVSVSPLSLLGNIKNIWSSVQRSRGLTSLFHPHQIKSKLAGDINNGVHNVCNQFMMLTYWFKSHSCFIFLNLTYHMLGIQYFLTNVFVLFGNEKCLSWLQSNDSMMNHPWL